MISQNLIIYKFASLYHILNEIGLDLNFKINCAENKNSLNDILKNDISFLVVSNKKHIDISNHFVLENLPINIFKLIEKINIEFLKLQFNNKSQIKVND